MVILKKMFNVLVRNLTNRYLWKKAAIQNWMKIKMTKFVFLFVQSCLFSQLCLSTVTTITELSPHWTKISSQLTEEKDANQRYCRLTCIVVTFGWKKKSELYHEIFLVNYCTFHLKPLVLLSKPSSIKTAPTYWPLSWLYLYQLSMRCNMYLPS